MFNVANKRKGSDEMGCPKPRRGFIYCVTECDGRWKGVNKIGKAVDFVYGQPHKYDSVKAA